MSAHVDVVVDGKPLRLSNLDKVLYPADGYTKADVIQYYTRIAPVLLPHLGGRPLTLKRYPQGVEEPFFYEKECPSHHPNWLRTTAMWSDRNRRDVNYCVVEDLPGLVWIANLADIELHTSLSLRQDVDCPTVMVFDLDPGPGANLRECARVALKIREALAQESLACFPKTSGSKGLQVYVPLNNASSTYADTKAYSRALARRLEAAHPDLIVSNMKKSLRENKVLIDWSQNDAHKTTVCVYSLRAKRHPQVSAPVTWDEVTSLLDGAHLGFGPDDVLQRVAAHGDLFLPVIQMQQRVPAAA